MNYWDTRSAYESMSIIEEAMRKKEQKAVRYTFGDIASCINKEIEDGWNVHTMTEYAKSVYVIYER